MLAQQTLNHVVTGLDVYDTNGMKIGIIKGLHHGNDADTDMTMMEFAVSKGLGKEKELPVTLTSRLYNEGFVCIERGFLRSDVIAFTNEVQDVFGEAIFLNVDADDLLQV